MCTSPWRRPRLGSDPTFDLSRVSADGRSNWTQRIKGESYSLTVDAAGTVYQSRKLNGVGVLDKRAADGRWLWSNEIEAMTVALGPGRSAVRGRMGRTASKVRRRRQRFVDLAGPRPTRRFWLWG